MLEVGVAAEPFDGSRRSLLAPISSARTPSDPNPVANNIAMIHSGTHLRRFDPCGSGMLGSIPLRRKAVQSAAIRSVRETHHRP